MNAILCIFTHDWSCSLWSMTHNVEVSCIACNHSNEDLDDCF